MKSTRIVWISAVIVSMIGFTSSRASLLINGSFEVDGDVTYSGGVLPPITGWTLVSGQRLEISSGEGASDGSRAAIFDNGLTNSTPASGTHSAVLAQTIATTPGTSYSLLYDYGAYGAFAGMPQKINAQVIGATTLANQTLTKNASLFSTHAISFVANSASTTIRFADATSNGEGGLADGLLDNVSLDVNNPAAISLANPSFESFDVPNDTYDQTTAKRYPVWIMDTPIDYGGLLIDDQNNARVQSGKNGQQFLQFNNNAGVGGGDATASQVLTATLQLGYDYTLSAAIGVAPGDFIAGYISHGAKLELLAQDNNGTLTLLGASSISGATINATTGTLQTYTLDVPGASIAPALLGQQLVLRLTSISGGGSSNENIFDNITLDAIPEPSTVILSALGSLVLWRRFQRK